MTCGLKLLNLVETIFYSSVQKFPSKVLIEVHFLSFFLLYDPVNLEELLTDI